MEFIGKIKDISVDQDQVNLTLSTYNKTLLEECEKLRNNNKELKVEIKRYSQKRSKDSNALAWHLMEEIAKVIKSDKDLVYIDMLGRYGVFTHIVVKPSVVPRVKEQWKLVKELGEVAINGRTGVQLQCYFGSSTYTQNEMCRFINGIIQECRDLNIPTPEDNEVQTLVQQWGN